MSANSPIGKLAAWLDAVGAQPDITPERLAPSTVYDLEYRVLIVAMAFQIHATSDRYSSRPRIQSRRLKLLQFVAMRPWLVSVIREWSLSRRVAQRSLDSEEGLKRGFISDTMHDDVIDFLVAAGALRREELHGASVIKCCYAATGMYVTAAAALLRGLANTRTTLSHQTTRRRDTKMSRSVSRRVASPACIAGVRVSRPNFSAPCALVHNSIEG